MWFMLTKNGWYPTKKPKQLGRTEDGQFCDWYDTSKIVKQFTAPEAIKRMKEIKEEKKQKAEEIGRKKR